MEESGLAYAVATAYEAATGGGNWSDFGLALRHLVGAHSTSLRSLSGARTNLLQPEPQADGAYLAYYHRLDPYRARAAAAIHVEPNFNRALLGPEILPTDALHRTEYFNDYAVPNGQHHTMGALIGIAMPMPLGLHRDAAAGPFTEAERRRLEALLPHLRRALQLQTRIQRGAEVALEALSVPVFLVDARMRVRQANAAAATLAARPQAGLRMVGAEAAGIRLTARHRDDRRALEALVAKTAAGGAGGAMRVRAPSDDAPDMASLAVLVSPAPARLTALGGEQHPALADGFALVVARELAQSPQLRPGILSDLYGLTHAEAAVAVTLSGGVTAEDVARHRQVSLDTVRSQVRVVLRKTNAANLRDFERILALLAAS